MPTGCGAASGGRFLRKLADKFRVAANGQLINRHGQIYTTLHPCDRHPEFAQRLMRLLP